MAYLFTNGFVLRSPVAIGAFLLLAGCTGVVNGFFLGVGQVAPTIVEGLQSDCRRRSFLIHQLLSAGTLLLLSIVLISTVRPLLQVSHSGISTQTWRMMALTYPDRLCSYQTQTQCAGSTDLMCVKSSAMMTPACPGHYCSNVCKFPHTVRANLVKENPGLCRTCDFFRAYSELQRCKLVEADRSTRSCQAPLSRQIKRFFLVTIISVAVVIIWMITIVLSSLLSPLLSD